jgi:hypothetical protein
MQAKVVSQFNYDGQIVGANLFALFCNHKTLWLYPGEQ